MVGIGHRREVGLGVDPQVERPEPPGRDVVGVVREDMREAQVIVIACHPRNGTAYHISLARSATLAPYWLPMGDNAAGLLADPPDQLRAFIRDGRITTLPAKRTRRRLLLDQVAQAFEPGRTYPEAEVDQILKAVFDDHCALRRYLIDEEFMSRTADGLYWRAGGTVS